MLTRRRFLRDLGTGLLVAAAAPVLVEPERKQWFVSRNAPVQSRARVFDASQVTVRVNGVEYRTGFGASLEVGEPSSLLERQAAAFAGIARTPGETDAELRARVLEYLARPPASASYLVDENDVVPIPRAFRERVLADIEPSAALSREVAQQIKENLSRMLNDDEQTGWLAPKQLRVTFKL